MNDTRLNEEARNGPPRWARRDALKVSAGSALGLVGLAATPLLTEAMRARRVTADVVTSATPPTPAKCKRDQDCPDGQTCKHKKHHKKGHCE